MQCGVVQGLFKHQLQDVLERDWVRSIVKIPNAFQFAHHVLVDAHADDKRLDHNALGLQGTADCAWVFVACLNAVCDEDDDISSFVVGKIIRRHFKRPSNGRGALSPDSAEGLLDDEVVG